MKKPIIILITVLICTGIFAQENGLPVIDMHLHTYTPQNYWGGSDFQVVDTVLSSPSDQAGHLESVIQQKKKYNIVLTYASGNFEALDIINKTYPDLFLPSAEIWPTKELLQDKDFLSTLEQKIKNGEVQAIGEVANFYTGIAPNDPVMDTLYRIAEKYDLPIGLHFAPGPPGSQFTQYPNMRLEYANPFLLQEVLIKFPKLRLNVMHAGLPIFMDEMFGMMFMFPNLYIDISAQCWYAFYGKLPLNDFLKKACLYGFGDRIMFGSDEMAWPGAIGLSVEYIEKTDFLTEKQKRDILYNNAARFLRLSDEEIERHHGK
ncbi:MAG: amidohydrolase family protein [Mariniphaga sp.]|nr:amidohydrolase family protein [Mariniphaga sp.]